MKDLFAKPKSHKGLWSYCVFATLCGSIILIASRLVPEFAEWYSVTLYPFFPATLGRLTSLLPFSLFEILILALVLAVLLFLLWLLLHLLRRKAGTGKALLRALRFSTAFCATVFVVFVLTCGVQYSRAPFAESQGLEPAGRTPEELTQLCYILIEDAKEAARGLPMEKSGAFTLSGAGHNLPEDFDPTASAVAAMNRLGETNGKLDVYYSRPKPVLLSELMSNFRITGIYSPFTLEANYNKNIPDSSKLFTMCHELAHTAGFVKEEDANFIAYLACVNSESGALAYSGTLSALSYSLNALRAVTTPEEYASVYSHLSWRLQKEFKARSLYWSAYTGPVAELAEKANNTYLKVNAQADGVRSYGNMVDLLLAYYAEEIQAGVGV